jgi:hypothetical protein
MLVTYLYDEALDRVAIATIQDARSSRAATTVGEGIEPFVAAASQRTLEATDW